jgi:hypothetical protein
MSVIDPNCESMKVLHLSDLALEPGEQDSYCANREIHPLLSNILAIRSSSLISSCWSFQCSASIPFISIASFLIHEGMQCFKL